MNITKVREVQEILINNPRGRRNMGGRGGGGDIDSVNGLWRERERQRQRQTERHRERDRQTDRQKQKGRGLELENFIVV